jgi:hypothetical protein
MKARLPFVAALLLAIVGAGVYDSISARPTVRSEFKTAAGEAYDAVHRCEMSKAMGNSFTYPLNLVDAETAVDALGRMAEGPFEGNVHAALSSYLLAVKYERNIQKLMRTEFDALQVSR